jgi:hypothetical protein
MGLQNLLATMDEEFQILIEYVIMSFDCYEFIVVCEEFQVTYI